MSGFTRLIVFISMFATITLISEAQYIFPIIKHQPTKQYFTSLHIGPAENSYVNFLLDLETNLTWLNCRNLKSLSSLHLITCQSSTCKSIPGSGCDGKFCLYRQPNSLGGKPAVTTGRVVQDKTTFFTTDGARLVSQISIPHFTFSCVPQVISPPIVGVVGLSPGGFSFWRQVTTAFNVVPKFALCLPSSNLGHFYVGGVDHYIIPPFNGSDNPMPMTLTPLKNIESGKYLISVTAIYVDGVPLELNPSLLEGGAKLSTVAPYTVLQTDIYNALAQSFTSKALKIGMSEVPGTAPFKHCFEQGASGSNMDVSVIEIGLPGRAGEVKWRFHGANTVTRVLGKVICLAFVDGGEKPNESMVIGTHQLENYMIEFDLSTGRMAFSDSLLLHNSSCSTWPPYKT